jgi:hypothetical protein
MPGLTALALGQAQTEAMKIDLVQISIAATT